VQQARQMFKQLEKQHTNTASGSAGKPNP